MNRRELKAQAKENIREQLGTLVLCTLIYLIITSVVNLIPGVGSLITLLIAGPLMVSLYYMFEKNARKEEVEVKDFMFSVENCFTQSFLLGLLVYIFTLLWTLLFIIPGIIKGYSYSMSYYIMQRNPNMDWKEALEMSKSSMDGHKMDLFVLHLSFIPWMLLCVFVIPALYVIPYMMEAQTLFYQQIYEGKQ